jgi:tetratricopeptide (TPR) repeat protein
MNNRKELKNKKSNIKIAEALRADFFNFAFCTLIFTFSSIARSATPKEQVYSLFSQANQFFREANTTTNDPDKTRNLYEKAILNYEKIISDGQIKNSKLYYNLANAYFLKEDIGKAILNYRRAQKLDKSDTNIQKNLAFARSRRIDKVEVKPEKRILETLFFWHYDLSIRTKFLITCILFAIVCISGILMLWRGKLPPLVATAAICGILTVSFLASIILENRIRANTTCGVITAGQVVARQGDGPNYPASFKDPLHAGTEFNLLERRPGWFHIRLSDDSEGWIPDNAAELI